MGSALHIGLTGGIGSGKSTVAGHLIRCGAVVIDADAIARSVTASGGAAIAAIAAEFGPDFITAEGALDRDRMRALAFTDPGARHRLEAIVHPLVGRETEQRAAAAASSSLVFDVPLLVESGRWRGRVDRVLVVDCRPETQVERVMRRNGWTRDAVERVIAAQADRATRLAAADAVIFNDAITLEELERQTVQLAARFGL